MATARKGPSRRGRIPRAHIHFVPLTLQLGNDNPFQCAQGGPRVEKGGAVDKRINEEEIKLRMIYLDR